MRESPPSAQGTSLEGALLEARECLVRVGESKATRVVLDCIDRALAGVRTGEFPAYDGRSLDQDLRHVLEALRDHAVISLDVAGRVTSWNRGAQALTGYQPQEVLGQHFSMFYSTDEIVAGKPVEQAERAGEQGRTRSEGWLLRRDGSPFWAEVELTALRDDLERLQGYVMITRDASERRRIDDERARLMEREQRARTEAEAISRSKDEFLATVSHELRTPLTAIVGWVRVLRSRGARDATVLDRALDVIERSARMQAQLIEDMLDLSRIVTGKLRVDMRRVELGPIVDLAIDGVRPTAEAKGITIERRCRPDAGVVSGDPDRLQQVVWNLLTNAIKFTPGGGTVTVRVERDGPSIAIAVRDSGIGIEAAQLPFIFDRFRQVDGSAVRRHGGMGLGLAIVRHLVELHGGTVSATSDGPGLGAEFVVRLPRVAGAGATGTAPDEHSGDAGAPDLTGVDVVVVEDEPDVRELLVLVLEQHGATVRGCGGAADALAAIAERRPRVLVADISLPGEDGYSLIRRVRAIAPDLHAVALTGYARPRDRMRILAAGYRMHISKPVDPAELAAVIASLAASSRA